MNGLWSWFEKRCEYVKSVDDLLSECDFVVPLCPLNDSTRHMFDASAFAKMKSSAVFVNAGRGELVDTKALCDALRNKEIFAAGLDCTDPEPLPVGHELHSLDNCFIVPHIGSATLKCEQAIVERSVQNLRCALRGLPSLNDVVHFF